MRRFDEEARGRRGRRSEAGMALIEAAFILPVLLVLAMGMLDFGRAFHFKHLLDEAAREGARVAVVTSPDQDIVNNRVNQVLGAGGITPTSITVAGPDAARMVTVTVDATFQFVTPGVYQLFHASYGNTLSMRGQSTMRSESP
jgi:Flp pilus assembly protein TadG